MSGDVALCVGWKDKILDYEIETLFREWRDAIVDECWKDKILDYEIETGVGSFCMKRVSTVEKIRFSITRLKPCASKANPMDCPVLKR